jgi:hypothetical protein
VALPKSTQVLKVKALTMNKRIAKALPVHFEARLKDLMALHFEGFTDPRSFDCGSYARAVLCTVPGQEGRAFWIVGSFGWLEREQFVDVRTVHLKGHPQDGEEIQFIALT